MSKKVDKKLIARYKRFCPKTTQTSLFEIKLEQIQVNEYSKLFVSLMILENDLIDLRQMKVKNESKYNVFINIKNEFRRNKTYEFFVQKYSKKFLVDELEVYYRNFESWLSKFGFFGRYHNNLCYFTEIGYEFTKNANDLKACSAIFLLQIKKMQVWNPTIDEKYRNIKVIPYFLILQLLLKLPENYFTKNEYVLFITKIKSHEEKDLNKAIALISLEI